MIKLKKLAISMLALSAVSAQAYSGLYVGGGVTSTSPTFKSSEHYTANGAPAYEYIQSSDTNVGGQVFLGYAWDFSRCFHLGLEAAYNTNNAQAQMINNFTGSGYSETDQMQNIVSLSLLPGYNFDRATTGYFRLGVTSGQVNINGLSASGSTTNVNQRQTGGQLGLGVEHFVSKSLTLRGEYTYTAYQGFSYTDLTGAFDGTNNYNIYSNDVTLAISYHFG